MKTLLYSIFILMLLSCKTKTTIAETPTEQAFIQFSQESCLGTCPAYDVWIFEDGQLLYEGIANVSLKGTYKTELSEVQLNTLKTLLEDIAEVETGTIEGRDLPKTTLTFSNQKFSYHETKAIGNLKKITAYIKNIISDLEKKV